MDVPKSVLDHWSSSSKLPGCNHMSIGKRKEQLFKQIKSKGKANGTVFCKWRASECCPTQIVKVALPKAPSVSGSARQAKVLASEKIKKDVAQFNMRGLGMGMPFRRRSMPVRKSSEHKRLPRTSDVPCTTLSIDTKLPSSSSRDKCNLRRHSFLSRSNCCGKRVATKVLLKSFSIDLTRLSGTINGIGIGSREPLDCAKDSSDDCSSLNGCALSSSSLLVNIET